jgi:hypothetical protein
MRRRALTLHRAVGLATALVALGGILGPIGAMPEAASATATLRPAAGSFTGSESGSPGGAVTFVVPRTRSSVRHFSATVPARTGCTAPYIGFQAPSAAMSVVDGHFTGSSTRYPGPKVRVTVSGRFISRTTAAGLVSVHFARVAGCNRKTTFRVTRSL